MSNEAFNYANATYKAQKFYELYGGEAVTGEWFGKTKPWDPISKYDENKLRLTWSPQDDGGILYRWDLGSDTAMVHLAKGWILDLLKTTGPSIINTKKLAINSLTGETLTCFIENGRYLTADQELRIFSTWTGIVASLSDGHLPTTTGNKSL